MARSQNADEGLLAAAAHSLQGAGTGGPAASAITAPGRPSSVKWGGDSITTRTLLLASASSATAVAGLALLGPALEARLLAVAGGALVTIWLMWGYPQLGPIALSLFTAGFVPHSWLIVSIFGSQFFAGDVVLAVMVLLTIARGIHERALLIPRWSIVGPLLAFAGCAFFSSLYAISYRDVSLGLVLGEARPAVYAALSALVVALFTRRSQAVVLLVGLFVVADVTALLIILQQFMGSALGFATANQDLWQINQVSDSGGLGSIRVVPPAHVAMYLTANVASCLTLSPLLKTRLRLALAAQVAFLSVGLLLTYTRAQWIASMIALSLVAILLRRPERKQLERLVVSIAPLIIGGLALVMLLAPPSEKGFGQAFANRAATVFSPNDTLGSASLEWRAFEVEAAKKSLAAHPLFGVGLGSEYREMTLFQGEAAGWLYDLDGPGRLTRFIHDSYLYLAVKIGIPGMVVFAWFCLAFLVGGLRAYRQMKNPVGSLIVLATVSSFAGLIEWSVFEAHFMLTASMTTVGLMVGIVASISRAADLAHGTARQSRPAG